jgi:prolyl oligopeptidase
MLLHRLNALLLLAIVPLAVQAAAPQLPPAPPRADTTETLHGSTVRDPFRNLENLKDPQTQGWLKAQGAYAADVLSRIPGRDALQARIAELSASTGDSIREVVRMPGDRLFYLKRRGNETQFKVVMREGLHGAEKVLVDPQQQTRATGVPHAVNYFVPSWDGRKLAYGMSAGGSENASLHLLDVRSGKAIGQPIARVPDSRLHWLPDNRSLTYNQLRQLPEGTDPAETYKDTTVFHLRVGDAESRAKPVFGPLVNPELKLDRLDVAEVAFAPGSDFVLARTTDTTNPEGNLFVADLVAWKAGKPQWRRIASADDKITDAQLAGATLYLRTYAGAPRSRILALDLSRLDAARPALEQTTVVVAEPARGVLLEFGIGRDALYTEVREGFDVRIERHPIAGASVANPAEGTVVSPPGAGTAGLTQDPAHAHADALFSHTTWTTPLRILLAGAAGSARDSGLLRPSMPKNAPPVEVQEVLVKSHDGAEVPLAILHRKGVVLDGHNPTLLVGYGAYGFSFESWFNPRALAWIEKGGVLAYANVRGSGAFGDPWYRAGFKATKPNTWKDGIACARYLIAKGYATPKTMGVWGTSAGGIFVGRAVTEAPELFAAAIFDVGIMDAVRAEASANGATNVSEFGTVAKPDEFAALLEMSPYHHIQNGSAYPGVLLVHGLNDPRVDVWHSAKAAARLQEATSSGRPVLLRLDAQAGHGVGSTATQRYSQEADIYGFLLWQMGQTKSPPTKE